MGARRPKKAQEGREIRLLYLQRTDAFAEKEREREAILNEEALNQLHDDNRRRGNVRH